MTIEPQPILYVDDERGNRLLFETAMLGRFDLRMASTAAEALAILEREPIDVLVTDNRMPGMTGVQLCSIVADRFPDVQRILVTAYADADSAIGAINEGGVSRYLKKPWNFDELEACLRDAQSVAVRSRLTRHLQAEILRRERMTALASMRGRVLHDLANAASRLRMCASELRDLVSAADASLEGSLREAFAEELDDLELTVSFVTDLHLRVRGLNRSEEPRLERLDIVELASGASVLAKAALPAGGRIDVEAGMGAWVIGDRTDVGRILVNLLTNAAQALSDFRVDGARIRVVVERGDDVVALRVQDNGPGVPASIRTRIFEEHFTTKGERGTGLGLAISRRLARENGGDLTLEDTARGASFLLALPRAPATEVRGTMVTGS